MKSRAYQTTPTPVLDLLPSLLTTKTNRPRNPEYQISQWTRRTAGGGEERGGGASAGAGRWRRSATAARSARRGRRAGRPRRSRSRPVMTATRPSSRVVGSKGMVREEPRVSRVRGRGAGGRGQGRQGIGARGKQVSPGCSVKSRASVACAPSPASEKWPTSPGVTPKTGSLSRCSSSVKTCVTNTR